MNSNKHCVMILSVANIGKLLLTGCIINNTENNINIEKSGLVGESNCAETSLFELHNLLDQVISLSPQHMKSNSLKNIPVQDVCVIGLPPLKKRGRKRKSELEEDKSLAVSKHLNSDVKCSIGCTYKIGKDRLHNHYYTFGFDLDHIYILNAGEENKSQSGEACKLYRVDLAAYSQLAVSSSKVISPAKVLNDKVRSVFVQKLIVKQMLKHLKQWILRFKLKDCSQE